MEWGAVPAPGACWVWKPGGDASCGPGCIPNTFRNQGEPHSRTPLTQAEAEAPPKISTPQPRLWQGGSMAVGIPRIHPPGVGAGAHHPECVGSPPTPSAVRLHAACAPVGRLGVKHLTDSGRNQPSRAASPLDSGGSRCVTVQVWEVTTILPPVAVTQVSLEPPGPVCVYGLICRGQDGNLAGCP